MRRTFWPCLALSAVLLAGCTGDPEPREPDPTGSTGPKPTATPPPLPEAATQETPDGAASFVDHYLEVLNYASLSGDVAALEELSAEGCVACQRFIDTVADTYAGGGSFEGGEWSLGDVQVEQLTEVWSVVGPVTTTPGTQIPEAGGDPRTSPETNTEVEFQIRPSGKAWVVMSLSGPES